MHDELLKLRRQMRWLRYYIIISSTAILVFIFSAFTNREKDIDIIRAKGIIIEDSSGKDRILIGAPIPFSKARVRTDTALVRKNWAGTYKNADQFMQWYKSYYHGTVGIVVMNESGFDRVLMGDKLADPNSGKRMFEAAGISWNDREGWERGGAGVNTTKEGKARSVMGVDNQNGEAAHIIALEDGTNTMAIGGEDGLLLIGFSRKDGSFFQNKDSFTGMKFFNTKGELVWEQKINK